MPQVIQPWKRPIRNLGIIGLSAVFLFVHWGCATQPPALPPELRAQLGTIGVVSAQYTPAVEFELPAKGWLGGAARGAAGGAKSFILLVPPGGTIAGIGAAATFLNPPMGPMGLLGALTGVGILLKGAGYMLIGPFYGAATAEASATVEKADDRLKAALASMRIQETMRDHVVQAAKVANRKVKTLGGRGPASSSDLLAYFPLEDTDIDSVLELRVIRLWLSSNESFFQPLRQTLSEKGETFLDPYREFQMNLPLSLGMEVRGRLIRTTDKVVLYDNTWQYEGEPHVFAEWAANDAHLFAAHFDRAYDYLAIDISKSMF